MKNNIEGKSIEIRFGAMSDNIKSQLRKQKFKFDESQVLIFEKEKHAINQLRFNTGILTDSMVKKCFDKLNKAIVAHVTKLNT